MQYLFRYHSGGKPEGSEEAKALTVGRVNEMLNRLASSEVVEAGQGPVDDAANRVKAGAARVQILQDLMRMTSPRQMKWVVQIILRELKVPLSDMHVCCTAGIWMCAAGAWKPSPVLFYCLHAIPCLEDCARRSVPMQVTAMQGHRAWHAIRCVLDWPMTAPRLACRS